MFSIYVPRVLNEHTVQSVTDIMAHFRIGIVHYVDFTPINKKPGFYETFDAKYKSAFIHFMEVPGYQMSCQFWQEIGQLSSDLFCSQSDMSVRQTCEHNGPGVRLQISQYEYWICLKNHSPVKRTLMNIHQVVENARYLEDRVKALEDQFTSMKNDFDYYMNKYKDKDKDAQNMTLNQLVDQLGPPKLQRHDTLYEDNAMTINELTTEETHWNVLNKSLFTKDKDLLRYYEYEHNWAYDNRFDR